MGQSSSKNREQTNKEKQVETPELQEEDKKENVIDDETQGKLLTDGRDNKGNLKTIVTSVNPGSFVDISVDKKQHATYPTSYLTKLYWKYGGKEVLVTGSFNDWSKNLPLLPSEDMFVITIDLPVGKNTYKYIVDGKWKEDPKQETEDDHRGGYNNVIYVNHPDQLSLDEGFAEDVKIVG